jgi:hypothetical protein
MLSLREIQHGFRQALLTGDDGALAALIADDAPTAGTRLDIHRNNVLSSLTTVLKETFPVICRLVDERFFDYAADSFVRAEPPRAPCLHEYGRHFPGFLTDFAPCRDILYLHDVAQLEWLLHCAATAPDGPALQPAALSQIDAAQAHRLTFSLQASYAYLNSRWPVDRIWRANRAGAEDAIIDLDAGGTRIELRRHHGDVEMRLLPQGEFAFRSTVSRGEPLVAATEASLAATPEFDAGTALVRLFADGAVASFSFIEGSL